MHQLREKTRSFQDQTSWLKIAKKWSFQENTRGSIKQTNTSQVLVSEDSARQEGPAEQKGQEDQVSGQPCEQHCGNTTKKAAWM